MRDGQLGRVVVMDDGKLGVRLDRGATVQIEPYHPQVWHNEDAPPKLQMMQLARVAYEADRALRVARGEYGAKEWMSMREQDRLAWSQGGPPAADVERSRLHAAVVRALS